MALSVRRGPLEFKNLEGIDEFDFALPGRVREPGTSAMVRVKDEGQKLEHVLRSILPVFSDIHVIDNDSADDTADVVRHVQRTFDVENKIRLHSYPYAIRRFGPEHGDTPADSIHSAVYFTNWSMSRCTRRYVCKWDGDMLLVRENRDAFLDLLSSLERRPTAAWSIAGQTLYRGLDGTFYEAIGEVNREVEIFPKSRHCRFHKAEHWEQLERPRWLRTHHFEPVVFYELKFLDEEEFDHWSTTEFPTERKRREWENFHRLREGRSEGAFRDLGIAFLDDQVAPTGAEATGRPADRARRSSPPEVRRHGLAKWLPHFLGIGAMRSGTTWLATHLASHPDIRMGRKEIHFFDQKLDRLAPSGSVRDRIDQLRYALRFARASGRGSIRGEITPAYAIVGPDVIARVAEWMPDVKLLFLMRDPIERAWSQARNDFPNWRGRELKDVGRDELMRFFDEEGVRRRGDYLACIDAWSTEFPREQFFFGFLDDVRERPHEFLGDVLRFLGADTKLPAGFAPEAEVGASSRVDMPDWVRTHLERTLAFDTDALAERVGRAVPWAR